MALARFGGGVSELRGSIAGNVFSRSRAGAIVRNRAVPVNPNTPLQSQSRSWMQEATDGFRDLTAAQVEAWNNFASTQTRFNRLGEPYTPSGKQIFTESFLNLLSITQSGPPVLSNLEANPNLPSLMIESVTITNTAGALTALTFVNALSNFGTSLLVQATPPMQPSVSNFQKYFRTVAITAPGASVSILAGYTAKYPTAVSDPSVGNVIGIRASAVSDDTGLASEWVYINATVPAAA